jgi:hypothetical protein
MIRDAFRSSVPSVVQRCLTPSKARTTALPVAWTHDARWRWATPSPSKENETPGTGDLELWNVFWTHNLDFWLSQTPLPDKGE